MKLKLKEEQYKSIFTDINPKLKEEIEYLDRVKKYLRSNIDIDESIDDVVINTLAEKEEERDEAITRLAFTRRDLPLEFLKKYSKQLDRLKEDVVEGTTINAPAFSSLKYECIDYSQLEKEIEEMNDIIPQIISKLSRAREIIQEETARKTKKDVDVYDIVENYFNAL
ncbi:hypothetical protein TCON_2664 [Astathelohania contejeani]|uniref:Uncharacterized protein n=1 Tax=Astathelohania contejeani TaxID=164912 RepID=A0ABQ7HVD6_9MICR|nr:hypothetical protein TCON_2664 [Thelohania contejeani]